MKRRSFQAKLTVLFILLLTVILSVTTFFIYHKAVQLQKKELQMKILGFARLMSLSIDTDRLLGIKPEKASEAALEYKQIRQELVKLKNTSPLIDSVYTMIKSDKPDIWLFLVDSGDKRKAVAGCGEGYDVSGFADMRTAFSGPSVDNQFTKDKWGIFLSAYAPILDSQKQAVAIIGLDVRAESVEQMRLDLAKRFLAIMFFGIIASLFLGWFFSRSITEPIRDLMRGVNELGKGNLAYKITLKTKDELADLAAAFNKMTDELSQEKQKLQRYYIETIKSLIRALEAKDYYTSGHSERVAHYATLIAKHLSLANEDVKLLEEVTALHDIGKMGIPEEILDKKGPLTEEEQKIIRKHPAVGEEILKPIEFLKPGLSAVSDHHERQDGSGYPRGLKAEQISLFAAIAAVADSFDAMTSDRPYRKALSQEEAISVLEKNKGKQFDIRVVDAFIEHLREQNKKA